MTNTRCKYLKDDLYCMIGKEPNESLSYSNCSTCPSFEEEENPETPEQKFESFCKKNDLEYDFSFMSGGKFYRSSETNKAFCIYKWSDFRGKG